MGAVTSKSPLERRNTVARRSQRRTIHSIKAKVDKLYQDVKRFKGVEEDPTYKSLRSELEHIKNDLLRKSKELQPPLRPIHNTTLSRTEEVIKALDEKLKENQEKAKRKEQENLEKAEKKKEKERKKKEESQADDNDVEVKEIEDPQPESEREAHNLEQSTEKRQTVELKFVQIVPDEVTQADVHSETNNNVMKSPEEKRKSILKMGVPVMPGAMMNEITSKSNSIAKQYAKLSVAEGDNENVIAKVNEIIESLQAIEYQIADFVGKKFGTQYNRIRDRLNQHLIELNQFTTTDDYAVEQINICKNYVGSCMSFLDEKSVEEPLQDDVFLPTNKEPRSNINSPTSVSPPPTSSLSPVDARFKLQRLSKTTAI